jgi:transcriptional regulator with XRE-family HTH domain
MIAPQIVTEVRRLLREEILSQRKIASLTGISRTTVTAIASGKRPDYDLLRQLRDDDWEEPTGPAVRCPGCGGRVHMPCQLCRIRKRIAEKRHSCTTASASALPSRATGYASAAPPHSPAAEILEPLGVNLRPEHRARYEEVRAWRIKSEQLAISTATLTPHCSHLTSQGA